MFHKLVEMNNSNINIFSYLETWPKKWTTSLIMCHRPWISRRPVCATARCLNRSPKASSSGFSLPIRRNQPRSGGSHLGLKQFNDHCLSNQSIKAYSAECFWSKSCSSCSLSSRPWRVKDWAVQSFAAPDFRYWTAERWHAQPGCLKCLDRRYSPAWCWCDCSGAQTPW